MSAPCLHACLLQRVVSSAQQTLACYHCAYSRPSLVARRLSESSASPWLRTKPDMGKCVLEPGIMRPLSSTLATEIWTELWSLASMRRPVAAHLRGT